MICENVLIVEDGEYWRLNSRLNDRCMEKIRLIAKRLDEMITCYHLFRG